MATVAPSVPAADFPPDLPQLLDQVTQPISQVVEEWVDSLLAPPTEPGPGREFLSLAGLRCWEANWAHTSREWFEELFDAKLACLELIWEGMYQEWGDTTPPPDSLPLVLGSQWYEDVQDSTSQTQELEWTFHFTFRQRQYQNWPPDISYAEPEFSECAS